MKCIWKAIVHICLPWESLIAAEDWEPVDPEERVSGCAQEGSVTFSLLSYTSWPFGYQIKEVHPALYIIHLSSNQTIEIICCHWWVGDVESVPKPSPWKQPDSLPLASNAGCLCSKYRLVLCGLVENQPWRPTGSSWYAC